MSDPNAQMNAQLQVAQIESAQMAGAPSGVFPGGMPHVMVPGQPVTTAQMAAAAAATKHPQDMTLAQIAAAQNASDPGKKPAKAKKTYQTKAMKAAAAANEANPASHTTSAVPAAAPITQSIPQQQAQQAQQQQQQQQAQKNRPPANLPLRQQNPRDIIDALKTNLDMIRREFAENLSAAAQRGEEFAPPSFQIRSQHDAAVAIELWLTSHGGNFNAEELAKKVAMLRDVQTKCRLGRLDPTCTENKIEALSCWVELTKTYYICARESRNLKSRGVPGIESPTFRLPDTTKQIPPPRPPEDFTSVAEMDIAMGQVVGAQRWVEAVERQMTR